MFGNQLLNSMRKLLYLIIVVLATSGCNKEIKHALDIKIRTPDYCVRSE